MVTWWQKRPSVLSSVLLLLFVIRILQPTVRAIETPPWSNGTAGNPCSITISYGARIGDRSTGSANAPIFVAALSLVSNLQQEEVRSWVIGWHFTTGEEIKVPGDVWGPPSDTISVEFSNAGRNQAVTVQGSKPVNWTSDDTTVSFVGRKGGVAPLAPFRVAPPQGLFFNNYICSQVEPAQPASSGAPQLYKSVSATTIPSMALVVDYMPIQYTNIQPGLFEQSFTQFYMRLKALELAAPVELGDVVTQYWFEGPRELGQSGTSALLQDLSQFRLYCSDATPAVGCNSVMWNITQGLPNVSGARFVLNIWFRPGVVTLMPANASSNGTRSGEGRQQLNEVEVILSIESRLYFASMRPEQDYSFLDTGRSPVQNDTQGIVLRKRMPNTHMPAYLEGQLAWGRPPVKGPPTSDDDVALDTGLPGGSYCQKTPDGREDCGVSMLYCCKGPQKLALTVPDNWRSTMTAAFKGEPGDEDGGEPSGGPQGPQAQGGGVGRGAVVAIVVPLSVVAVAAVVLASLLLRRHSILRHGRRLSWQALLCMDKGPSVHVLPTSQPTWHQPASYRPPAPPTTRGSSLNLWPMQPDNADASHVDYDHGDCWGSGMLLPEDEEALEHQPLLPRTKAHTHPFVSAPALGGQQPACQGGDCGTTCNGPPPADPAPRRGHTWAGEIHPAWAVLENPFLRSLERRRTVGIPPLELLPPPINKLAPPAEDVDLDVDFKAQVEPKLGRLLGSGGYGRVFEAEWRSQQVAVKVLAVDTEQVYEALVAEIELCSRFRSNEHVVRLLGASLRERANVCLIMELVEGGTLADRIYDPHKRRLDYLEILQLGHDIAAGLAYLHPCIIHRDLKPQNILLDRHGRAKIADFGISRFKDPHRSYLSITQPGGTPNYMAPELFNGTRVDEKTDVYSLGCILYECFARRTPFAHLTSNQCNMLYRVIVAVAVHKQRPPIPEDCPQRLREIIQRCWREDPRMRPSAGDLMRLLDITINEEIEERTRRGAYRSRSNVRSAGSSSNLTVLAERAASGPMNQDGS